MLPRLRLAPERKWRRVTASGLKGKYVMGVAGLTNHQGCIQIQNHIARHRRRRQFTGIEVLRQRTLSDPQVFLGGQGFVSEQLKLALVKVLQKLQLGLGGMSCRGQAEGESKAVVQRGAAFACHAFAQSAAASTNCGSLRSTRGCKGVLVD